MCALGNSVPDLTDALRAGRSGIRLIAADPVSAPVAGGFPLLESAYVDLSTSDKALFDPVTRYAMHAAREALEQCGLLQDQSLRQRTAVYLGTAMGGAHSTEEAHRDVWYHGTRPKPLTVLSAMANAPAAHLSIRFGLTGPSAHVLDRLRVVRGAPSAKHSVLFGRAASTARSPVAPRPA